MLSLVELPIYLGDYIMNMKNDIELLDTFQKERNIQNSTKRQYLAAIQLYTQFNNMSMVELLEEAEKEEVDGVRWAKRKLRQRLLEFRTFLANENYKKTYVKNTFSQIQTIYRHFGYEIHLLPRLSDRNINQSPPITVKDLPDKEIIKQALEISDVQGRALVLFMSSSGCARQETLNLTIQDFIDATNEYHSYDDIYDVIDVLKGRDDIIPIFKLKRQKTNKYYHTFCSPEATNEILNYLSSVTYRLDNRLPLFQLHKVSVIRYFEDVNDKLKLGKKGPYNRFRSHMLRKFHASSLKNDGMSLDEINSMQGKSRTRTDESYFFDDPIKLREKYIQHLDCLTINWDINNVDIKSPEYIQLEKEIREKDETINRYEELFQDVDSRLQKLEGERNKNFDVDAFEL